MRYLLDFTYNYLKFAIKNGVTYNCFLRILQGLIREKDAREMR